MSRYYRNYSSDDSGLSILGCIALIVVMCFILTCCNNDHIKSKREDANMVYIEEGYCYDADTRIIYRETIVNGGRYYDSPVYSPYINENGNYCKYEKGQWIEFIKN